MRRLTAATIEVPAAAARASRTPWNQLRRRWKELMVGRPEDQLVAGLWSAEQGRRAIYLGVVGLLVLPAFVGLGLAPSDTLGRWVLIATAAAALFSASEIEADRRARGAALLPVIAGFVYGAAVSAVYAAVLWSTLPGAWARHGVVFLLYPLLLLASALRGDPRFTVALGFFATLGYCVVVAMTPGLAANDPEKAVRLAFDHDAVNVSIRVVVLLCATALGAGSAERGRVLRRLSHCDPLTGLISGPSFRRCIEREARRCLGIGLPMSIAVIDLDRFRLLNDAHGHAFGDGILRWVADLLRESFRNTDIVARLEGERFAVAFLDSDHPALVRRLEALRSEVADLEIRRAGLAEPVRLTLSAGLARFPREGASVEEVTALAAERLHAAKRAGRDRVVA
jgi:diguanylate cyclase (GGDEF)-like protein